MMLAPLPLPDSLTVTWTPYFLVKYDANDLAKGPTVVEPSRTIVAVAASDVPGGVNRVRARRRSNFFIMAAVTLFRFGYYDIHSISLLCKIATGMVTLKSDELNILLSRRKRRLVVINSINF